MCSLGRTKRCQVTLMLRGRMYRVRCPSKDDEYGTSSATLSHGLSPHTSFHIIEYHACKSRLQNCFQGHGSRERGKMFDRGGTSARDWSSVLRRFRT